MPVATFPDDYDFQLYMYTLLGLYHALPNAMTSPQSAGRRPARLYSLTQLLDRRHNVNALSTFTALENLLQFRTFFVASPVAVLKHSLPLVVQAFRRPTNLESNSSGNNDACITNCRYALRIIGLVVFVLSFVASPPSVPRFRLPSLQVNFCEFIDPPCIRERTRSFIMI